MKKKRTRLVGLRRRGEQGYTLLEYCAGAAVIAGVLWASMSTLGDSIDGLLTALSNWTINRTTEINDAN